MYTTEKIIYCSLYCCNSSCCKLYFVPCNVRSKAEKLCEVYTTMMDNLASFAGF